MILALRTDKPDSELYILDDEGKQIDSEVWAAHRQLASTLHNKIDELLSKNHQTFSDARGIIVFKGPGSFTGLRIGTAVANALSDSFQIPVVGVNGDNWLESGLAEIKHADTDNKIIPEYGSLPLTTPQKR